MNLPPPQLLSHPIVVCPWVGERNVEGVVTEKFLHVLARLCHRVSLITQDSPQWTVCPAPSNIEVRTIDPDAKTALLPPPWWYGMSGLARQSSTAWNWAARVAEILAGEIRGGKYSMLVCRYLPPEGLLAGYLVRQQVSIPWWGLLNDPFPGWAQNSTSPMTLNGFRVLRDSWFCREVMATERAIFTYPAWHMRNHTVERLRLPSHIANRIDVLYHVGIPDHLVHAPETAAQPDQLGSLFRYFGGFYGYRDPAPLLQGWRKFQEGSGRKCTFEIYGREAERLDRVIRDFDVKNVRLCEPVSYREACRLVQEPCVLVHVDPNGFQEGIWVAGKLADYLESNNVLTGWVAGCAEAREISANSGALTCWANAYTPEAFASTFHDALAAFRRQSTSRPRFNIFSERAIRGQILRLVEKLAGVAGL